MPRDIQAKLLIVDDLPENLLALEALIKGGDREVFKALSADEALSLLLQHDFALAIIDVQMPDMNGFQLAELMRGTEKTRSIPIIFVSAAGRERNYAFTGYENGAVDFLHKPLDTQAVKSKVNVFVELYRQRKAMKEQVVALEQSRREQEVLLQQLEATRGELEQAVRMRDDFMSIVAHEVRTAPQWPYPRDTVAQDAPGPGQRRSLQPGQGAGDGRARRAPDQEPDPVDRGHAGCLADSHRQAVDPPDPLQPDGTGGEPAAQFPAADSRRRVLVDLPGRTVGGGTLG